MDYNEDHINELKENYDRLKDKIKDRIKEFHKKKGEDVYLELLFCILTPQSKAKICWNCILSLEKEDLFTLDKERIKKHLKGVRFHNNKSNYIENAIKFIKENRDLYEKLKEMDENGRREYIMKNIKGIGLKEASHFLRNIGLGENLAILDRHILKNLLRLNVIEKIPRTLTRKRYFEIEKKMIEFSKYIGISMEELDLLLCFKETGEVFK
jgi:N-glycosylase/DNA lyase